MLSPAGSKTNHLDEKTRQLISLAVAVTTRCDGCIVVHTDAALKAGAKKEEIAEALGVAVGMNAGAALVYSTRVLDAVDAKSAFMRSEEHTSELQSQSNLVCRLLLEKKKEHPVEQMS